jgi:hypothetical protein
MSSAAAASAYLALLICSGGTPELRASASNCVIDCATWSINWPVPARDSDARSRPSSSSRDAAAFISGLAATVTISDGKCAAMGAGIIGSDGRFA